MFQSWFKNETLKLCVGGVSNSDAWHNLFLFKMSAEIVPQLHLRICKRHLAMKSKNKENITTSTNQYNISTKM